MEDVVRQLGILALGTRLRRLGEKLQSDTQEIMSGFDLPLSASQFPYLAALDRLGPLGVGELSQALGVAQPGVTRTVGLLGQAGLVEAVAAEGDQRRRIMRLTKQGRTIVAKAKADIWPMIEGAVADLCGDEGAPLLALLGEIEVRVAQRSLAKRAARLEGRQ